MNRPQLVLVRHAQSENNAGHESERTCDPSITKLGHRQAEQVSKHLSTMNFDSVLCSAFRRALQTAQYIGRSVGQISEVVVDMHEHGGCYEGWHEGNYLGQPGMTSEQIAQEFGEVLLPDDFPGDGWWQSKTRESHMMSDARARRMSAHLLDRLQQTKSNLVCVTHADFLSKLLLAMFDREIAEQAAFHDLKNVGITRVTSDGSRWQLIEVNYVDFLQEDLVSS